MKKGYLILFAAVGFLWVGILFYGLVTGLKKTFRPAPKSSQISARDRLADQRAVAADIAQRNKLLMEDRERTLEDRQLLQQPTTTKSASSSLAEQKARTEALMEQNKRLMEDRKQRLRDMQRR